VNAGADGRSGSFQTSGIKIRPLVKTYDHEHIR